METVDAVTTGSIHVAPDGANRLDGQALIDVEGRAVVVFEEREGRPVPGIVVVVGVAEVVVSGAIHISARRIILRG